MMNAFIKYSPFVLALLVAGCGSQDTNDNATIDVVQDINDTVVEGNTTLVSKLNALRVNSGLVSLNTNAHLTQSSLNHATYLSLNNMSGHYESNADDFFTGVAPVDRTVYSGYKSRKVSENVSTGQEDENLSLDGLMSAIYHRFGFLSFEINEIGYAKKEKSYVYNMGNSNLNTLCSGVSFSNSGTYYLDVCADKEFKIEYTLYDETIDETRDLNSAYVVYPYKNQQDVTPSFYEESPDPLPNYGVSGYPISIEFNSYDYNMSKLIFNSFTLEDATSTQIELIEYDDGSTIMTQTNDENNKFNAYQFAIFPHDRLDYNTTYNVKISYTYDNEEQEIEWSFKTKELENLIVYQNADLNINLHKDYYLYFKPEHENDTVERYSTNCSYQQGGNVDIQNSMHDANTLLFNISGNLVESCELTLNNEKVIRLNIE